LQQESSKRTKFAENMGMLRREKGLSQRQAALELGVSQALLSHYETDAREPKLDFVIKVCDFYSVTTDFILGRTTQRDNGASSTNRQIQKLVDSLNELKTAENEIISKIKDITTNAEHSK